MAARNFQNRIWSFDHDSVMIEGRCAIGNLAAVTGVMGSGIEAITNESGTGKYSFLLTDSYRRFLFANITVACATSSTVAKVEITEVDPDTCVQGKTKITFTCYDYAGAAVDPIDGSKMYINVIVRNSSVKGKGE